LDGQKSKILNDFCAQKSSLELLKAVAFPRNSDHHILGIPAGDELRSVLNKYSLPSSLACGLPSPAFIADDGRIELSYSINFFVGVSPSYKGKWKVVRK